MPFIQQVLRCELDPAKPVPEICAVISALLPYHSGREEEVLRGVTEAIEKSLEQMKGDAASG